MSDRPEFDPEYINQLLKLNADRIRELERALLEAQKAMMQLAAVLASVAPHLEPALDAGEWAVQNRLAER